MISLLGQIEHPNSVITHIRCLILQNMAKFVGKKVAKFP